VIRFLAVIVAIAATLGGSYGAIAVMRAVGPEDQSGDFGYGDAATIPPGGGTLLESRNFARVVAALERELGPEGGLQSLTVRPTDASAMARVGGDVVFVDIDASGRSRSRVGDRAEPAARVPVDRLDASAIDAIVAEASRSAGVGVESLTLQGGSREWRVDMLDGGEPDSFVANLDGAGLRLQGEPNPEPVGAEPDSLLRAENLAAVLDAAARDSAPDARVTSLDIRPDRVSLDRAGRLARDHAASRCRSSSSRAPRSSARSVWHAPSMRTDASRTNARWS
jgi:hypothetical protein